MPVRILLAVLTILVLPAVPGRAQSPTATGRGSVRAAAGIDAAPGRVDIPADARGRDAIAMAIAAARWDEAARLVAEASDAAPRSRPLLLLAAHVFTQGRRPLNAAVALKKAEALAPLAPAERLRLALAYIAMGRGDWARPELERIAREDPREIRAAYWLGRVDYDAGLYDRAIARLEEVVRRDPGFVRAHDNLGLCYEAQHQTARALASYREAVRLNRQAAAPSPWPPLNLALLQRQQNAVAEAELHLREALRYDDRLPEARYALGTLLEAQGRDEEAIAELTAAASARTEYAEPHYALARIHRRRGDAARAAAALAAFERLNAAQEARRP